MPKGSPIKSGIWLFVSALTGMLCAALAQGQNLFVTENQYANVDEFAADGTGSTILTEWGQLQGLACDSAGDLFVAAGPRILEIAPGETGTFTFFALFGVDNPYGLAFNGEGNLFSANYYSGNIYEFTPSGTRSTFASGLNYPVGLAFDTNGDLFESDGGSGNIYEFRPNGSRSTFASGLDVPWGLAFNNAGILFAADGSGSIYEFAPNGARSTFASGFTRPNQLAFNSAGDLFVADGLYDGNGYVAEISPEGVQSTFVSGLGNPVGLAFQPVPEPTAWSMVAIGMLALLGVLRQGGRSVDAPRYVKSQGSQIV
ncbi:MAG: NHL repeat-containing protein [Verrucomicrobiia bacterium]